MKKTTFLFLLGIALAFNTMAQTENDTVIDVYYDLLFNYDAPNSSEMDSVFIIECQFDKKDVKEFKKVKVKTGKQHDELTEIEYDLSAFVDKKKVNINLGKVDEYKTIIEVYVIDADGKEKKLKNKKTK